MAFHCLKQLFSNRLIQEHQLDFSPQKAWGEGFLEQISLGQEEKLSCMIFIDLSSNSYDHWDQRREGKFLILGRLFC